MEFRKSERLSHSLMCCLAITFTIITFAKINYSASVAYIVDRGIFTKSEAGFINSAYFLVYSLFQIFGGKILDRMSPYFAVSFSIVGGIVTNIALTFTTSFVPVMIFWTLNGFFQFSAWPGVISLTSEALCDTHKKNGVMLATLSISGGSMLSFAFASIILESLGWSGLFVFNAVILVLSLVYWIILRKKTEGILYIRSAEKQVRRNSDMQKSNTSPLSVYCKSGLVFVFFVILFGSIGSGIKSWMPTMMLESYNVSTIWSGLQTAVIYVCNMLGVVFLSRYMKRARNEAATLGALYALATPFVLTLLGIGTISQLMAIVCFVLISTLTCGTTNITAVMSVRLAEKGYGHSGSLAGIVNGFASLATVIASTLFGYIAEYFDWQRVIVYCIVFFSVAFLLAIPAYFLWKRFIKE